MLQVTECARAPALRLPERPSNVFQVLLECASALWWPFEYLRVPNCRFSPLKTFCKVTGNGPLYQYIELFKKFFIILINGYFLRNKICEFYHLLQARFNHSNGFRKLSSNSLQSFRKANTMDSAALVPVKLLYSRRVQFYYWSCKITGYLGATVFQKDFEKLFRVVIFCSL